MHFGDELAHNPTMMSLEAQVGYSNGEKYFQKIQNRSNTFLFWMN